MKFAFSLCHVSFGDSRSSLILITSQTTGSKHATTYARSPALLTLYTLLQDVAHSLQRSDKNTLSENAYRPSPIHLQMDDRRTPQHASYWLWTNANGRYRDASCSRPPGLFEIAISPEIVAR